MRRISLWSTPRTVSTACLRAFAGREDCIGVDEPFYAHYLSKTGKQHPLREEVLAALSSDWRKVVDEVLLGESPLPIQFVKQMSHHMVGEMEWGWVDHPDMRHVFLLRDPQEQLPSMERDLGVIEMEDVGWKKHFSIFQRVSNPIVLDSRDLLENPEAMLRCLCRELELDFKDCMIQWEPGRYESYGVGAPFWYKTLETTTGFQEWKPKLDSFPDSLRALLKDTQPIYKEMRAVRLVP